MQIYVNMKSGNPVTILEQHRDGMATVRRIDCDKELLSPLKSLKKVEDFISEGGELCSRNKNMITNLTGIAFN
jgi:hypothetical protein